MKISVDFLLTCLLEPWDLGWQWKFYFISLWASWKLLFSSWIHLKCATGLRKTKSHISASFTSDGRYIVSVGEDSNVYVWNCDMLSKPCSKEAKSIRSFELFFSDGVSVAVPWPKMEHRRGSCTNGLHLPSPPLKILEPSTWLWDSECLYLGSWLFTDGASRVGPEEKLPKLPQISSDSDIPNMCKPKNEMLCRYPQLTSLAAVWSLVIVTASSDGCIRSFHNYGLPVFL